MIRERKRSREVDYDRLLLCLGMTIALEKTHLEQWKFTFLIPFMECKISSLFQNLLHALPFQYRYGSIALLSATGK